MNILLILLLLVTSILAYEEFCAKNFVNENVCTKFEENDLKNKDILNQAVNSLTEKLFDFLKSAKYSSLVVKKAANWALNMVYKQIFQFYLIDFLVLENEKTLNCRGLLATYVRPVYSFLSGRCNNTEFYVTDFVGCDVCKCCWNNTHPKF